MNVKLLAIVVLAVSPTLILSGCSQPASVPQPVPATLQVGPNDASPVEATALPEAASTQAAAPAAATAAPEAVSTQIAGPEPTAGSAAAEPTPGDPEEVVQAFYAEYLGFIGDRAPGDMRSPLSEGAYRQSPYLAPEFVAKVDKIVASLDKGGYDPFLCAQDAPDGFTIDKASVSGDRAEVVVHTSFQGHEFKVSLERVDGPWKIADVVCGGEQTGQLPAGQPPVDRPLVTAPARVPAVETPAEPPIIELPASAGQTAGWRVFRDPEYGFQVRYPPAWVTQEVALRDAGLEKPVVRIVGFKPQGWTEDYLPFTLEISQGTLEEYRRVYPEPTRTERTMVGGRAVTVEEIASGDTREIKYVFESPADPKLRVTIHDFVSGFPARARGNNILSGVIKPMVSSFRFTK